MEGEGLKTVRLSGREALYLKNAAFLPDTLSGVIQATEFSEDSRCVLTLLPEVAGSFGDALTERLARAAASRRNWQSANHN